MGKRLQSGNRQPNPRGCITGCLSGPTRKFSNIYQYSTGNHFRVLLEVGWEDDCCEPQVEMVIPVYNKTNVLRLQTFLRDKFAVWVSNGSSVEEKWNNYKNIVYESIELLYHMKYFEKNSDPEYYNKKIKRL
jgi:hypothetical protein